MADYNEFRLLIQSKLGLNFDEGKQQDLMRRVQTAMQSAAVQFPDLNNLDLYYARLARESLHGVLWKGLVQNLTINETYFFRDSSQIHALRHHILPALIEQRRRENYLTLRVWSAGCASGEEPYTLAILLHQLLPDLASWNILILGTDINRNSIAAAEKGYYTNHAFRKETPETLQERYFQPTGKGYTLMPAIKRMVRFGYLNLVEDAYPSPSNFTGNLDLILCRNVTIYFERPTTERIITRFRRCLVPDGWLVVGHSEPMLNLYEGFKPRNFEGAVVYQKSSEPVPTSRPVTEPLTMPEPLTFKAPVHEEVREPAIQRPQAITAEECYEKGKTFADRMAWKDANHWLTRALSLNPLMLVAHFTRAMVLLNEGDQEAALAALERTLYLDRNFVMGHFNIGLVHWRSGRVREATRAWSTARNLIGTGGDQLLPHSEGITGNYLISLMDMYLKGGKSA